MVHFDRDLVTPRDHLHKYVEATVKSGLARGLFHRKAPVETILAHVFEQAKRDILTDSRVVVEAVLRDVVGGLAEIGIRRLGDLVEGWRRGGK